MLPTCYERDMSDQARGIVEDLTKSLERLLSEHDGVGLRCPSTHERTYLLLHTNDVVVTGTGKAHRHELPQHRANPEFWPAGRQHA